MVIAVTKEAKLLFKLNETVSISLVTLDNTSPVSCVSKYLSGNLLIFLLILSLNLLANLLDTVVNEYSWI